MPKLTIKNLQAEIATLRELRESDRVGYTKLWNQLEEQKKLVVTRGLEIEDLRKDKRWLQQLLQHMVAPDLANRTSNALTR